MKAIKFDFIKFFLLNKTLYHKGFQKTTTITIKVFLKNNFGEIKKIISTLQQNKNNTCVKQFYI
jgi:hypothetical protein